MDKKYDVEMLKDYERISSMTEEELIQMLSEVDLPYNEIQDLMNNLISNDRMDLVVELFIEKPILENAILAYINDPQELLEALQEREKACRADVYQAEIGGGSRILRAKEDYEKSKKAISRLKRSGYLEQIDEEEVLRDEDEIDREEIDREEILREADEEYLDYLDSLATYKIGDNQRIDRIIQGYLEKGYLPSYIQERLEDYGYTLAPEDLKELYYKCGYEYDIESGASRKINEFGENVTEEAQVEYDENGIFDSTDRKQVEFFLKKYLAQKESMEVELREIKSKMAEMEREMHSIGGSEFDPEFHELFDLHDRMEELEDAIAKSTERVDFYQSVMELHRKEEELSKLEAEERTISEAEVLIDKQTGKVVQDIGEE